MAFAYNQRYEDEVRKYNRFVIIGLEYNQMRESSETGIADQCINASHNTERCGADGLV